MTTHTSRYGKTKEYYAYKALWDAGKNTFEIAQQFRVREAEVYNTLSRVGDKW